MPRQQRLWPLSDAVILNSAEIWLAASVSEPCSFFKVIRGDNGSCTGSEIKSVYWIRLICFAVGSSVLTCD
eukprot:scaffold332739_cov46-Prasinocladus_malaysianus.AAC.1